MLGKNTVVKTTVGIVASLAIISAGAAIAIPTISGATELTAPQNQTVSADSLKAKSVDISSSTESHVDALPAAIQDSKPAAKEVQAPSTEQPAQEQSAVPETQQTVETFAPVEGQSAPVAEAIQQPLAEAAPQAVETQQNAVQKEKSRWHLSACYDNGDGTITKIWESDDVSGPDWSLGTAEFTEIVPNDNNPYIGMHLTNFEEQGDKVSVIWESDAVSGDGWDLGTAELIETIPASQFFVEF